MILNLAYDPNTQGILPMDVATLAVLFSGLAPTLIIVRVAYRKKSDTHNEQNENVTRSMAFADRPVGQSTYHSPSVDLRFRLGEHEKNNPSGDDSEPASGSNEKIV
ncbi:hypothetical protein E1B28_003615 [Marasmius oreades]|uniref:Uncharacterized protein n=1 Tax=Marasmius oreades TaxID=181124 RepID=A0A9P7UMP7_9AGAR|nr:uncharacterized protein E1B28_003615 [Marasmius oreades]KAG7086101.1 hypothetical protein E1B28_003615 [Marasmius oreades]